MNTKTQSGADRGVNRSRADYERGARNHEVVDVILAAYMSGRDQLTNRELAELLGVSIGTAAKRAMAVHDAEGWTRIEPTDAYVPRGHWGSDGTRRVEAWTITKRYLATLLNESSSDSGAKR